MSTVTLEVAQEQLSELIHGLSPGGQLLILENNRPVAQLTALGIQRPTPIPGRGIGMLTIVAEDGDHLADWAEYMP